MVQVHKMLGGCPSAILRRRRYHRGGREASPSRVGRFVALISEVCLWPGVGGVAVQIPADCRAGE
jgi:hypothetical protein